VSKVFDEAIELSVDDFLEISKKYLPKTILEHLKKFINERVEGDVALITTEEIVLFLVEDYGVPFDKIYFLLKELGLSDSDIDYLYSIIAFQGEISR